MVTCVVLCGCDVIFTLQDPPASKDDGGVGTDSAAADAAVDAFTCTLDCPLEFGDIGPGSPTNKYLVVMTQAAFGSNSTGGAAKACVDLRNGHDSFTHLVVFDDQAEYTRISTMIDNSLVYWVGHRRGVGTGGLFAPITEQPSMFPPEQGGPWGSGEPDTNNNHCAEISVAGTLNASPCQTQRAYICECSCFAPLAD